MKHTVSRRRQFLRLLTAGGLAYAIGRTSGLSFAQMSGGGGLFGDYKALVCLFLFGGNDSWNMLVPMDRAEYDEYYNSRGGGTPSSLAVEKSSLLSVSKGDWVSNGLNYGFHPQMAGLQRLFNEGQLAVLPNVGPLVRPISKREYMQTPSTSRDLPPQLFSHNDQQEQWNTLRGRFLLRSGWGGRISDLLAARVSSQQMPLNVSLFGQTIFQTGDSVEPYVIGPYGAQFFQGLGVQNEEPGRRANVQAMLDGALHSNTSTYYERGYARVQRRAIDFAQRVNEVLARAPSLQSLPLTGSSSLLTAQLSTVAKLIAQRSELGMTRQIFFVGLGGFDTHDRQLDEHPKLLADISNSVSAFHAATRELGVAEQVTLFTQSDFGRTLTSNGDGSDHGWGGIQFVVGGGVRGGRFYGEYPLLSSEGPQTLPWGGAVVPEFAVDQYAATLAQWFGVGQEMLPAISPNIVNFGQWNLGFMV